MSNRLIQRPKAAPLPKASAGALRFFIGLAVVEAVIYALAFI